MHQSLLSFLKCIFCNGEELILKIFSSRKNQIEEGLITCGTCEAGYPVTRGIPRMIPNCAEKFKSFLIKHGVRTPDFQSITETETEKKTVTGFNRQLAYGLKGQPKTGTLFSDLDPRNFLFATETTAVTAQDYFQGKVFLDVGLGSGQYSYHALSFGAQVISMDINTAGLEAYHQAFSKNPLQHVIMASALALPIKTESIDYAWSMGVLHHTDDLLRGFREMARVLKVGGMQNIGVYYQYRHWPYYQFLRRVTTRLPFWMLWPICWLLAGLSYLPKLSFVAHPWVEKTEPFRSRLIGAFDHFHPPVQGYYTPEQVSSWFRQLNCFDEAHMTPVFNNFIAKKTNVLAQDFSDQMRASIVRC